MNAPVNTARRARRWRKGAMIPLVAVSLIILLVAAAFSVDVAYMYLVRQELHIATDAAAKAAVTGLSQGNSQQTAINTAVAYAAANTVAGKPLAIDANNIQFGSVAYAQSGYWDFSQGTSPTTAVRVSVNMVDGTVPGSVPLLFGRLLGTTKYNPVSTSIAALHAEQGLLVFRPLAFDVLRPLGSGLEVSAEKQLESGLEVV